MKKLLAVLLFAGSSVASASYIPLALSTGGVNASTVAVVNAAGAALKVDGSAVTQPVSGTFFQATQPISGAITITQPTVLGATVTFNGAQPVTGAFFQATQPISGAVTISQPNVLGATVTFNGTQNVQLQTGANAIGTVQPGNTQNTTAWLVQTSSFGVNGATIAVTNAGGTKLAVTPDSVALPANQSVNVSQMAGTTADTNSGTKSAGTLRVVLATDQPALTNKLLVTPDSVALPANQSVNVAQMAGVTTSMNTGVRDTGTQRVTIATNDIVPASQSGTWTVQPGNTPNTTPWVVQVATGGVTAMDQGFAASGAAAIGNPIQSGLRVSSTTVPTAASDGQIIYQASDNMGRALVTGMPWGVILSTYATVMSSNGVVGNASGGTVLVSSAGANNRIYLCGISFTNTTATANEAVITSPPGATGSVTKTKFMGIPASFISSGLRHDCANPFFASAINSNIGIYQSQTAGATAAIHYDATYFIGP